MAKHMLTGGPVALAVAVTFASASACTTIDRTKQTGSISQVKASLSSAPDVPLDRVGIPDERLATEYEPIWSRCPGLLGLKTRFRITGTLRGRRVDVELRLALAAGLAMRLEPVVPSGSPSFVLQANDGSGSQPANGERGTLFIRQSNRVVRDKIAALMDTVLGLPIGERELLEILTGCPTGWSSADFTRVGPDWFKLITPYGDEGMLETYLHRDGSSPWTCLAAIHHQLAAPERMWRIDFLERRHDVFGRLRVRSLGWLGEFDRQDDLALMLEFASFDGGALPEATIPKTARETSLADLKSALPLITAPTIQRNLRP